jgi:D-alanyl-lipoteichoic acid acyltransferase DltB (MBOAT superfamily)
LAFPTLEFAYFFLLTATVSWALRSRRGVQKLFLLLASYAFYAKWDYRLLLVLAGVSLVDWLVAETIVRASSERARRALLTAGIATNVGVLCVFKLYDFFRDTIASFAQFLSLSSHLPVLEILLPAGISFYTFQGIAYIVDVYRGNAVRAHRLLDFLLFMAFFPRLLAGPICRSRDLIPQIAGDAPRAIPEPSTAVALILTGLFKKMVVASTLATRLVDDAFVVPSDYSASALWVAVFGYTVEIYMDFSGYTDLARGLALLLGFRIPENFNYPYAATNLGEYWRRWHMTFSTWLRDYVYFPLGGSRVSRRRSYFNVIATFLVCGIWHGSQWTFVIWGVAHGVGLCVYRAWLAWGRERGVDPRQRRTTGVGTFVSWAATLTFCAVVRIPFKAGDLETTAEFLRGLVHTTGQSHGVDPVVVGLTVLGIAANFVGRPIFEALVAFHARMPSYVRPLAWIGAAVVILALKTRDIAPYIYFGF